MINNIYSNDEFTQVIGGNPPKPHIQQSYNDPATSQSFTGEIRYGTQSLQLEVFDGNRWVPYSSGGSTSVGLSQEARELLLWAKQKRKEEQELERLGETNPAVRDLVDQLKEKQDQIKMVTTLLRKDTEEWHDGMAQVAMQAP